jgi:hypothetical protein
MGMELGLRPREEHRFRVFENKFWLENLSLSENKQQAGVENYEMR